MARLICDSSSLEPIRSDGKKKIIEPLIEMRDSKILAQTGRACKKDRQKEAAGVIPVNRSLDRPPSTLLKFLKEP